MAALGALRRPLTDCDHTCPCPHRAPILIDGSDDDDSVDTTTACTAKPDDDRPCERTDA